MAQQEDFMTAKWRPAMGWTYMVCCIMDMVIFPVIWSLAQVLTKQPITQWNPLTLQGAGLFHMAMGAVLGVAAFGRTQEKVAKIETGTTTPPPAPAPTPEPVASVAAPTAPAPVPAPSVVEAVTEAVVEKVTAEVAPASSKVAERMARFKK